MSGIACVLRDDDDDDAVPRGVAAAFGPARRAAAVDDGRPYCERLLFLDGAASRCKVVR